MKHSLGGSPASMACTSWSSPQGLGAQLIHVMNALVTAATIGREAEAVADGRDGAESVDSQMGAEKEDGSTVITQPITQPSSSRCHSRRVHCSRYGSCTHVASIYGMWCRRPARYASQRGVVSRDTCCGCDPGVGYVAGFNSTKSWCCR